VPVASTRSKHSRLVGNVSRRALTGPSVCWFRPLGCFGVAIGVGRRGESKIGHRPGVLDAANWGTLMGLPDRVLEPVERLSEILFGLIMALTITGAVSVATADQFAIRTMLFAALGCNLAWGIIDAGMYLMARLGERGRNALAVRAVREAVNREDAHRIIANELPPILAPAFQSAQLELIRERINKIPASDVRPRLTERDWRGALGVCILVILSTFPVVIPFIVITDARLALRISNALAVILLFLCGFLFGRHAGLPPWGTGLIMVAVGVALVSIAIALGG